MKLKVIFAVLFCAVIVSGNVFAQTFKRFEVKEKTGDVLVLETKTIPATVVKKDEYGRLPKVKINCVKWWEISEEKRSWSCTKTNFPEQIPSFEVSALPVTDDNVKKVLAWANNKNTKQNYKYKKLPNHANDIEAAKIFAWCNAFSESRKLEPVYYDADGNVIRNGESDDIYIVKIKADANGYRVPFISECYAMGAAGMPQSVFAKYMGVSKKTVEAWECGRTHPTGSAFRLMEILNSSAGQSFCFIHVK